MRRVFLCDKVFGGGADVDKVLIQEGSFGGKTQTLMEENVLSIIDGAQVVVDGLDNSATRLVVNSACIKRKIPYIYGGVSRLRGMITTIMPGQTPCLACFSPEGVGGLGVLRITPALIANLQALDVIKLLIGLVHH
jgi:molybdopterin/thiamine biosynthesis adenylyltransferase